MRVGREARYWGSVKADRVGKSHKVGLREAKTEEETSPTDAATPMMSDSTAIEPRTCRREC